MSQFTSMKTKNVVIIGGGNGGSISIRAMKQFSDQYDISAVVGMSDSGSSSGKLRKELGVLPPGDILRAVLAMSRYEYDLMKRIFYDTRFSPHGKLQGYGLGHLFIALSEVYSGSILDPIRALAQAVDAVGPVFPASLVESDLCVEFEDGTEVCGEHEIDRPTENQAKKIVRAWLDSSPEMYERAGEAIRQAEAIVIGPGSFYTSIIASILPQGMVEALKASHAKLIYVTGNAVEIEGERGPERLSEFVMTLERYLPRPLDCIVYNNAVLSDRQQTLYTEKKWRCFEGDVETIVDRAVIAEDYEDEKGGLCPEKLGNILKRIIL